MTDPSEQPRRRRRQQPQPEVPTQGSPARGAILVVVALVIGILLLRDEDSATTQVAVGTDTSADVDDTGDGGDGTDGATDGDADATSTTTTSAATRPPSEVKVLVANGSGVDGAAGSATDTLEALGYVTATPANAERVPSTVVYFTSGFEAEAAALAEAIGAEASAVTEMPAVAPVDDLQLSNILVLLGPELASG